jgi:hypothetical protein
LKSHLQREEFPPRRRPLTFDLCAELLEAIPHGEVALLQWLEFTRRNARDVPEALAGDILPVQTTDENLALHIPLEIRVHGQTREWEPLPDEE